LGKEKLQRAQTNAKEREPVSTIRPLLWTDLRPSELIEALSSPPDRYRPVPWLAWTGDLHWPALEQQLRDMHDKGITEFFLFPIYGMEFPYMSDAYWERVGQTLHFCRANGMKCWIYDEYNWPSGVCAGRVLRDHPEHNEQHLWLRTAEEADPPPGAAEVQETGGVTWTVVPNQSVHINVRGCDWLSPVPGYLDVLSVAGNQCFIELTHDRYYGQFPGMFPETIPGFFTDEPGMHAGTADAWSRFPYTPDLFDAFRTRYGYDLRERLADLIIDSAGAARTRCHYWRLVSERFGLAYGKQQRDWCDERGVALTGHCLAEETLSGHVRTNGDIWEILRHFTIPGIDMLANADGFNFPYRVSFYGGLDRRGFHLTCKVVHGVVRHSGGREMLSEAYGVCDWGMNLFRQKCGFNYQVALGVTLFNDNSLITSIADFRKWAIAGKHFTQPWWQHYKQYADYNARLAALHAEGEPVAEVAVLYPRSAIWARYGADDRGLELLQSQIYELLDELIRAHWHFDFVFEPVLAEAHVDGAELVTEHARYRALVVPSATELPRECVDVLSQFAQAGGFLVFSGEPPAREVDSQAALADDVAEMLVSEKASQLGASGEEVCRALDLHLKRPITLTGEGSREFVSSWRRLADSGIVFVANMAEAPADVGVTMGLDGPLLVCDPDSLEYFRPKIGGDRQFQWHFEPWQAFLIIVEETVAEESQLPAAPAWLSPADSQVLDGEWEFSVEPGNTLRLDLQARPDPENCGVVQGWQRDTGDEGWVHTVDGRQLPDPIQPKDARWYWTRTVVHCEAPDGPQSIVCDNPDFLEVYVNGRAAEQTRQYPLWAEENVWLDVRGLFVEGPNTIHVRARTSKYSDPRIGPFAASAKLLQPVVLVGDFLVEGGGHLVPWKGTIRADQPWEEQGLPHVAGVGVYRRTIERDGTDRLILHLPQCTDAVELRVNGETCGVRAWPPYVFELAGYVRRGANDLEIRVRNTLGNIITETYGGSAPDQPPLSGLLAPPRLLGG